MNPATAVPPSTACFHCRHAGGQEEYCNSDTYSQSRIGKFQIIESEFNLEAYKYNPKFKEDRGIEEIQKKFEPGKNQPTANANKDEV